MQSSIDKAKANFQAKYNKTINKPVKIIPAYPNEYIGLQIIDYYLWAVQRLYEKGEDRFFQLLANDFRLIMDLDDIRNKDYGEWYSDQNKLDLNLSNPNHLNSRLRGSACHVSIFWILYRSPWSP